MLPLSELMKEDAFHASDSPPPREFVRKCSTAFSLLGATTNPPTQAQERVEHNGEGPQFVRVCAACNGYYGPAFWQPVCATCHAFLYANHHDAEITLQIMSQAPDHERRREDGDDSDHDSGNEEPTDQEQNPDQDEEQASVNEEGDQGGHEQHDINQLDNEDDDDDEVDMGAAMADQDDDQLDENAAENDVEGDGNHIVDFNDIVFRDFDDDEDHSIEQELNRPLTRQPYVILESLSQRLALLSIPRPADEIKEETVEQMPTELLLFIFSFLDDVSLYAVGHVCRRWHNILRSQLSPEQWQIFTRRRWPLFKPATVVFDWFTTYSTLVESSFCITCIYQMAEVIPADLNAQPLREKRLVHDLRQLVEDPPPGIKAQPLDSSNYHWQASITGPVGSPYEGGIFFLYLKVPFTFPFDPPVVRFLTRIFHPNVSRHGDIGIDSLQKHNWVSGLSIPKVLISIQSLLTDPHCDVCMEPEIGDLYNRNRLLFDAIAKMWTWQYAMNDFMPPKPKCSML